MPYRTSLHIALSFFIIFVFGCAKEEVNEKAQGELNKAGYSEAESVELSKLTLSDAEVEQLEMAKMGGLDGTAAAEIIKTLHDQDLKFDIGMEMQTLSGAGFSGTALVELVKMGAVRLWESDLRIMKHAGISEPTILTIARRKFADKKDDVLAGHAYERLKISGMSDAGIELFVKNGGTQQQLQEVEELIKTGTSEPAALKKIGM